jgi:hypothetical protein
VNIRGSPILVQENFEVWAAQYQNIQICPVILALSGQNFQQPLIFVRSERPKTFENQFSEKFLRHIAVTCLFGQSGLQIMTKIVDQDTPSGKFSRKSVRLKGPDFGVFVSRMFLYSRGSWSAKPIECFVNLIAEVKKDKIRGSA